MSNQLPKASIFLPGSSVVSVNDDLGEWLVVDVCFFFQVLHSFILVLIKTCFLSLNSG